VTDGEHSGSPGERSGDSGHDPIAAGGRSPRALGLVAAACAVLAVVFSGAGDAGRNAAGVLLVCAAAVSVLTVVSWQMVSVRAARLGRPTPRPALVGASLAGLVLLGLLLVVLLIFWAAAHMN